MWVYKITNLVNGKVYVGKTTSADVKRRFKGHCNDAFGKRQASTPLHRALRLYGAHNFAIETLEHHESNAALIERESFWIRSFNTTNPEIGYNVYASWKEFAHLTPYESGALTRKEEGYLGVLATPRGNFSTSITHRGDTYARRFSDGREAAEAYDKMAIYFRGRDYAHINFPERAMQYSEAELTACFDYFASRNKVSRFRGVIASGRRWRVSIRFKYKTIYVSKTFDAEEGAAKCYDKLSLFLRGEECFELNVPEDRAAYLGEDLAAHYRDMTAKRAKSSRYRFVNFHKGSGLWHVRIKGRYHGAFDTELSAHNRVLQLQQPIS